MSALYANTDQHNFLSVLARGCPEGLKFVVAKRVDFIDENGRSRSGFPTELWREQPLAGVWYFSTGATDVARSRRKDNLKALRAIVIDDVGTKVPREKLLAAPTWELETSPGNFQLGYMLKEWTTDIKGGDELFAGLVAAGLQDPGVSTCCRLFRLPDSLNDKKGREPFKAILHSFDKDIVYTLKSLAAALKVKPGKVEKKREHAKVGDLDPQEYPDAVYDWLLDQGMVRYEATGGWWHIDCPFEEEHSPEHPDTSARFIPRWASATGSTGVKCFHGHDGAGDAAYTARFKEWLKEQGAPEWPEPARPSMAAFGEMLRKMQPPKPPGSTLPTREDAGDPSKLYNYITLRAALGDVDLRVLPGLENTQLGDPKMAQPVSFENVEAALQFLGIQPRLNLMNATVGFTLPDRVDPARFGLKDEYKVSEMVRGALSDVFGRARMKDKKALQVCIDQMAGDTYWHPMKDWVESKPWDGQDRFEALAATLPTPTPGLFRTYFRRWLLQTIEATCGWIVRPDNSQKGLVLVLVGKQRIGKTRWLMSLAPGFSKMGKNLNLNGHNARDDKHQCLQAAITELGELDATFRKSDIAALKAFITEVLDEYRLPYAQTWLRRPRCTSFCGSVNEYTFLNDPTGSGRFLPVEVDGLPQVDHAIDMQQLWAQVHSWWQAGEQWWLTPAEASLRDASSGDFQAVDAVAEVLEESLAARSNTDVYPVEVIVGARAFLDLCKCDSIMPKNLSTATRVLVDKLGKGRDLSRYGTATKQARWVINAKATEAAMTGVYLAKPGARRA